MLADEVTGPLSPEQHAAVVILDTSSQNLQALTEQLLTYNRQLSGQAVRKQRVVLAPLVATTESAHRLSVQARRMHTKVDLMAPDCLAGSELLRPVPDNPDSNAVYCGKASSALYVRSRRVDAKVYIEIANTDQPISKAGQQMIFEPFYQGRKRRVGAIKGNGLELSMARDYVARMQEQIGLVEDTAAGGSYSAAGRASAASGSGR